MSQFVFANNVNTTLASAITSPSQTTITLSSAANLPTLSDGEIMALTLNDAATQAVFEIVYVTAIAGANLTVVRGQEGTTARTWLVNDFAFASNTAGIMASLAQLSGGSGSLKFGQFTGVTVGTAVPLSFPAAFATNLLSLSGGISAGVGDLSAYSYHTDSETKSGFNLTVTGGPPGGTVSFWYLAIGD
jgi:hypothetical protein